MADEPTKREVPAGAHTTYRRPRWVDVLLIILWPYWAAYGVVRYLAPSMWEWLSDSEPFAGAVLALWFALLAPVWIWALVDCWRRQGEMDAAVWCLWLAFVFAGSHIGVTAYRFFGHEPLWLRSAGRDESEP